MCETISHTSCRHINSGFSYKKTEHKKYNENLCKNLHVDKNFDFCTEQYI